MSKNAVEIEIDRLEFYRLKNKLKRDTSIVFGGKALKNRCKKEDHLDPVLSFLLAARAFIWGKIRHDNTLEKCSRQILNMILFPISLLIA
ncbi:MAG: hypothetical protein KGH85_09060, partial [Thaumarchaeota archaeon]|nr:hypothetical protein [Nitrososphaerota archaeon]